MKLSFPFYICLKLLPLSKQWNYNLAIHDFRSQRLFIDAALSPNAIVETEREQANYLLNVLRMRADDQLLVFNGRDGEWRAALHPTGRKNVICRFWSKRARSRTRRTLFIILLL